MTISLPILTISQILSKNMEIQKPFKVYTEQTIPAVGTVLVQEGKPVVVVAVSIAQQGHCQCQLVTSKFEFNPVSL